MRLITTGTSGIWLAQDTPADSSFCLTAVDALGQVDVDRVQLVQIVVVLALHRLTNTVWALAFAAFHSFAIFGLVTSSLTMCRSASVMSERKVAR